MATATKRTEVPRIEQKKLVEVTEVVQEGIPAAVVLTLTPAEAETLHVLLAYVGGTENSPRKYARRIAQSLFSAGVAYEPDHYEVRNDSSSIYFKDYPSKRAEVPKGLLAAPHVPSTEGVVPKSRCGGLKPASPAPAKRAFQAGDKVRVVRKVEKEEGYKNAWISSMDDAVNDGKVYTVSRDTGPDGIYLEERGFGFPPGSLELAESGETYKGFSVGQTVEITSSPYSGLKAKKGQRAKIIRLSGSTQQRGDFVLDTSGYMELGFFDYELKAL